MRVSVRPLLETATVATSVPATMPATVSKLRPAAAPRFVPSGIEIASDSVPVPAIATPSNRRLLCTPGVKNTVAGTLVIAGAAA